MFRSNFSRNNFSFNRSATAIDTTQFATVNQSAAHHSTSERYAFIPTSRALTVLADYGWMPTRVDESRANKADVRGFQKHLVVLRHQDTIGAKLALHQRVPEILLMNSHNGANAFKLMLGIFEMICTNGLVVCTDQMSSLSVRHVGYADEFMESALRELSAGIPRTLQAAEEYTQIKLAREEQEAFAAGAIELRWNGEEYAVNPNDVLYTRHRGQEDPNLWNTFNRVQEAVIKGGVDARNVQAGSKQYGKTRRARPVQAINENVRLNQAIWTMMEKLAEYKKSAA